MSGCCDAVGAGQDGVEVVGCPVLLAGSHGVQIIRGNEYILHLPSCTISLLISCH